MAGASISASEDNRIPVQTAILMRRWGREDDALRCDEVARAMGLMP
jgi:hypothetical protein